jgi:hypothetical protein
LLTNLIYCLNQVPHQMIAVKYQLIFRPRHMLPNRGQIRTINPRYTSVKIGLKLTSIQAPVHDHTP